MRGGHGAAVTFSFGRFALLDRRFPRLAGLGLGSMIRFLLLVTLSSVACGAPARTDAATPPPKPACRNLDSQLDQLARSSDPEAFAASSGLVLIRGSVRVIVETTGTSDLVAYSFTEDARYADQVQGTLPIGNLCALSSAPGVRSVRPLERPDPARTPDRP